MTTRETVYTCPRFKVLATPTSYKNRALMIMKAGMKMAFNSPRGWRTYTAGSFVHSSLDLLSPGETMQERWETAVSRNPLNKWHWINAEATSLTRERQEQDVYFEVSVGQQVLFEGCLYTVETAPNDNLRLVEIAAQ